MKLKVLSQSEINGRKTYKVEFENNEYFVNLYRFQESEPVPDEIECIQKFSEDKSSFCFVQDVAKLISDRYTNGQVYRFQVRKDFSRNGYYELSDEYGFYFRISSSGNYSLYVGQEVMCRILIYPNARFELEFERLGGSGSVDEPSVGVSKEDMVELIVEDIFDGQMPVWGLNELVDLFMTNDEPYSEIVDNWLVEKIEYLMKQGSLKGVINELKNMRDSVLYILEETDYLSICDIQQRKTLQTRLSLIGTSIKDYISVIGKMEKGTVDEKIHRLLENLKVSGYVFQAEDRFDSLIRLFTLDHNLMGTYMPQILEIIHGRPEKFWQNEPFRKAFIRLLELYISESKMQVDIAAGKDMSNIRRVLEALAIQMKLADPVKDADIFDYNLNKAMMFRYASYIKTSMPRAALLNSFETLSDVYDDTALYSWEDTLYGDLLASKLSARIEAGNNFVATKVYSENGVRLEIDGSKMLIKPDIVADEDLNNVIPPDLIPFNPIKVMLPEAVKVPKKRNVKDLKSYQNLWKDIELSLFHEEKQTEIKEHLLEPSVSEEYEIIVQYEIASGKYACKIITPGILGEGYIAITDIVSYLTFPHISAFRDENGNYLKFRAKVVSIDENMKCHFNAAQYFSNAIVDYVDWNAVAPCIITSITDKGAVGVSRFGYCVKFNNFEDFENLKKGDVVVATNFTRGRGIYYQCDITTVGLGGNEYFTLEDAVSSMLYTCSLGTYCSEDEIKQEIIVEDAVLDKARVSELMSVIDCIAALESDYVNTYNYLGFARILAKQIEDGKRYNFYCGWMKLISILHHYAVNGVVPAKDIEEFEQNSDGLFASKSEINRRYKQLQAVSWKGLPGKNEILLEQMYGEDEEISELSKYVYIWNLLENGSFTNARKEIEVKIQDLLKVKNLDSRMKNYGEEGLKTEFKTSIVFPPENNMRPDLSRQTSEIMKEICAMLNASGGTLYIGVSDYGLATGIENDLAYDNFKGDIDKYDNYVRNQIRLAFGKDVDAYISTSHENTDGKIVYIIEILPYYQKAVKLNGILFERHGASKVQLKGEYEVLFNERRANERAKSETVLKPAAVLEGISEVKQDKTEKKTIREAAPKKTEQKKFVEGAINSSILRGPVKATWEEGCEAVRYIHFTADKFYLTSEYYDTEDDDTLCTIEVKVEDESKYLLLAYEDGGICRVPMKHVLDKKDNMKNSRNTASRLSFVEIAGEDEALMTILSNKKGAKFIRFDSVENLKEETNLNGIGEKIVTGSTVQKYERFDKLTAAQKLIFLDSLDRSPKELGKAYNEDIKDKLYKNLKKQGLV